MPAEAFPFILGSERVNKQAHGPFAVWHLQSPRAVISALQTLCPLTFLQCLEGPHTERENVKYRLVGGLQRAWQLG